jgi:hypothetical protein
MGGSGSGADAATPTSALVGVEGEAGTTVTVVPLPGRRAAKGRLQGRLGGCEEGCNEVSVAGPNRCLRAPNGQPQDLQRGVAHGPLPGVRLPALSASDRRTLSVCAPNVPQLRIRRPDLPGRMPPHPCVRVAVDERQVVPHPRPPGHQIKTRCRALGWQPVPGRQDSWRRCPSARGENEAWLGGDPPAPPGFGCRYGPSAGWCERRNPARTTTPSHVLHDAGGQVS